MRPQNMLGKLIAPLAAMAFALALACGTGSEGGTAERPSAPSSAVQTERAAPVMPTGEIGFGLGDRIPEFKISLTSGEALSSAQLRASERPTFLFFFSMTWSICRSELRSLTGLYPEYADGVDFYAVNVDLSAELDELEAFGQKQGYPWRIAHSDRDILVNLHVTQQSTKIAFGGDGVIIYREGMGRGGLDKWREVFENLSG